MNKMIDIEVAYGAITIQKVISLQVARGITVQEAIESSGILKFFPEIDLSENKVGIFGKLVSLETILRDKDRVEIYRPLLFDPKASRRDRATAQKTRKQ